MLFGEEKRRKRSYIKVMALKFADKYRIKNPESDIRLKPGRAVRKVLFPLSAKAIFFITALILLFPCFVLGQEEPKGWVWEVRVVYGGSAPGTAMEFEMGEAIQINDFDGNTFDVRLAGSGFQHQAVAQLPSKYGILLHPGNPFVSVGDKLNRNIIRLRLRIRQELCLTLSIRKHAVHWNIEYHTDKAENTCAYIVSQQ